MPWMPLAPRFILLYATSAAALVNCQVSVAADRMVEERIESVANGLLPPVVVKDEPLPLLKLTDRIREAHVPGVSVAVINDGKLEWARGFGVVKIDGPPVTAGTLFQAASISKPVSALAVMSLVQAGKLDLDVDVNEYLKSWKLPANEFTKQAKVTLRGLLTHTAGITVSGFAGYQAGGALPTLTQILDGQAPANNQAIRADIAAGKTWRYSGGGYVIATLLLNDVSGEPFVKLMRERILNPLGMKNSTFQQPLPPSLLARAAIPYRNDGTPIPGGPHVYPELGAAALWTTPSDLARFAIGMQQVLSGKSKRVLTATTARAMLTPVYDQQAIGFIVDGSPEHRYFNHGGSNAGYRCLLVAYENGDGAVIMTNSDSGDAVLRPLLAAIARVYEWPDYAPAVRTLTALEPEEFDPLVGAYRLENGMTVTFWREGTHRYSRIWGQGPVELFPTSQREYFLRLVDARWIFADGGTPEQVVLLQGGRKQSGTRLHGEQGQAALDLSLMTERRVREQTAAPGTEDALRQLIAGIASGKPNYERMVPALAALARAKLPDIQTELSQLGAVESVRFKRVTQVGEDVYDVCFEHGSREFYIQLDTDGLVYSVRYSP